MGHGFFELTGDVGSNPVTMVSTGNVRDGSSCEVAAVMARMLENSVGGEFEGVPMSSETTMASEVSTVSLHDRHAL